jgi:hypothetical protein
MTAWLDQRDAALLAHSRPFATAAFHDFRALKAKVLKLVKGEQINKRQALDKLRRKYEKLRAEYLRIEGTTYSAWLEIGPTAEWDECIAAAKDDAVWDRLVERGLAELR